MKTCDEYCANYGCRGGYGCAAHQTKEPQMTPLEQVHARLGYPKWFWPAIGALLLVLWMSSGNGEVV